MSSNNLTFSQQLRYVFAIAAVLIIVEAINLITNRTLNSFSILPRDFSSLPFILTAPLLHGDLAHFLSNIFTLCIFAFLLLQYGVKRFYLVTLGLVLLSGILVWLLGRTAYHLGASGVVYGYFAYLVLAGLLSKRLSLIVISLVVGIMYGSIVWGVLPITKGVSWESHLFGFLSGLILAYWFKDK